MYGTPADKGLPSLRGLKEIANMVRLGRRILHVAKAEGVKLIHAHSPVLNALPAIWAGRKLRLPVVYEIRAFWEDAAVLHGSTTEDSLRYRATRLFETYACRRSHAVVTICEGLKSQLLERRIPRKKIFVLPNGVDTLKFQPSANAGTLRASLGLQGKQVIGFIGSLYRYEGLQLLVEALPDLAARFPDLRCLIVGQGFGEEEKELRELAARLGVADRIHFSGRVPHEQVLDYYALIDILVYPRVRSRLLELVTPLKILEALSLQKAVVGSDVGGIREIIEDRENGRLFKADSKTDLVSTLAGLIDDKAEQARLALNGRRYVLERRNWDTLIESHREAYRHVGLKV